MRCVHMNERLSPGMLGKALQGNAAAANRTREIRPYGMRGGPGETWLWWPRNAPAYRKGRVGPTGHLRCARPRSTGQFQGSAQSAPATCRLPPRHRFDFSKIRDTRADGVTLSPPVLPPQTWTCGITMSKRPGNGHNPENRTVETILEMVPRNSITGRGPAGPKIVNGFRPRSRNALKSSLEERRRSAAPLWGAAHQHCTEV